MITINLSASKPKPQLVKPVQTPINQPIKLAPKGDEPSSEINNLISSLTSSLQAQDPNIANYVNSIHKYLLANPNTVTILSPEDKRTFFAGLSSISRKQLIEGKDKSKKPAGKKQISMDDLL
jgi:hypothetical protein